MECRRRVLYQPSMQSKIARWAAVRVGQAAVEQLGLDGGEERLGDGVVPALAGAPDRQRTPSWSARRPNWALVYWQPRSEWKITPVGGRRRVTALAQGLVDQVGAQMVGGGPADDPARGEVDDGGQVEPPFPGVDVGDVAAPAGVDRGGVGGEVPPDQIRAGARRPGRGSWWSPPARAPAAPGRRRASAGRSVYGRAGGPRRRVRRAPAARRRCRWTRRARPRSRRSARRPRGRAPTGRVRWA